ncbi:MAG: 5-(carboxyamino)imidazole ribonucleotide mutase [Candidatus Aureabacteria bacterium]|nr:5-(carboxyamino)imidazole ribonucleotide mutase [Candidatus Auribacterota bacterium]
MATPIVSIIMGSKSDFNTMKKAADVLDSFDLGYEMEIMSAHRTPEKVAEYAKTAAKRGLKIIICGAGMSAHLAGVVAAHTDLPVIGIPLSSAQGLGGMDALLSTAQMPKGVPVAAVAINGSVNAALLAIKILALSDNTLTDKFKAYKENMRKEIEEASQKMKKGESPL